MNSPAEGSVLPVETANPDMTDPEHLRRLKAENDRYLQIAAQSRGSVIGSGGSESHIGDPIDESEIVASSAISSSPRPWGLPEGANYVPHVVSEAPAYPENTTASPETRSRQRGRVARFAGAAVASVVAVSLSAGMFMGVLRGGSDNPEGNANGTTLTSLEVPAAPGGEVETPASTLQPRPSEQSSQTTLDSTNGDQRPEGTTTTAAPNVLSVGQPNNPVRTTTTVHTGAPAPKNPTPTTPKQPATTRPTAPQPPRTEAPRTTEQPVTPSTSPPEGGVIGR